jgi:hypothetical protein
MKNVFVAIAIAVASLTGSNEVMAQQGSHSGHGHTQQGAADQGAKVEKHQASADFQKQLTQVFEANNALKTAFVESDAEAVKAQAQAVQKALASVDKKQVHGKANAAWAQQEQELSKHLSAIAGSNAIEEQRKHYAPFSQALYSSIKTFGLDGTEAYYQYCPMAFNNQGGYWLSSSKEIRNPYFGSRMLKCGSTKETLK